MEARIDKLDLENVMACPDCDLLLQQVEVVRGQKALCPRCGHMLYSAKKDSLDKTLALSFSGLILYLPANFLPLMTLDTLGLEKSGSIYDGVISLYQHRYFFVAIMVALTSLIFPLAKLSLLFLVSLALKLKFYPRFLSLCLRYYHHLDEWGMLEVYMVGILVTIIKMYHMAHIQYDAGFFCFIGLLWVALGSSVVLDEHLFWRLIEQKNS
ncbi:MAG: paraquat-inducible protein A [Proteobacteria bacterium]|nr:paraquat-inducible protein A [Pseudomonadota bacterium]MBU4295068.1 paraquat-inducible protein A [Pseudomonadota bacterium]MCG2748059.1 paraquat-inducible protein A [Desulfobulbaceae bacterium]